MSFQSITFTSFDFVYCFPTSKPSNVTNNQAMFVGRFGGTKFCLVSFPSCYVHM